MDTPPEQQPQKPNFLQLVTSVLAAFVGVQSDKNRQRDFEAGDPKTYIMIGIVAAMLLVLGLIMLVNMVVPEQ